VETERGASDDELGEMEEGGRERGGDCDGDRHGEGQGQVRASVRVCMRLSAVDKTKLGLLC